MINPIYTEIAKIFWKNTLEYRMISIDYFFTIYIFRDKVRIDKLFDRITNNLKYEPQSYKFDLDDFNYRASSRIFTIATSDNPENKKIEMIRTATNEVINDIFVQNDIFKLLNSISNKDNNSNLIKESNLNYFSSERIQELKNIKNTEHDISKIIKILEEVNICYNHSCYLSISSLLRMLIDHIPPIFWYEKFNEVVASYKFSKSDKGNMNHLIWWLKNISDWNLHNKISKKEILPTQQTIEFRADFDVLIKNIILILSK